MKNVTIKYKLIIHTYYEDGSVSINFNGDLFNLSSDQIHYVQAAEPTLFKRGIITLHDVNDRVIEFLAPSIGYNVPATILIPNNQKDEYKAAVDMLRRAGKPVDKYVE
ncbi:MAG: hypothetical protein ACI4VK_05845 [Candidatus Coproplasma sp.]